MANAIAPTKARHAARLGLIDEWHYLRACYELGSCRVSGESLTRIPNRPDLNTSYAPSRQRLAAGIQPYSAEHQWAVPPVGRHEPPEYAALAERFVGHAAASIADRHYISDKAAQDQFDRAVTWLGARCGF